MASDHSLADLDRQVAALPSTRVLNRAVGHRTFWRITGILLGLIVLALFLPWQQNVQGTGRVSAVDPRQRPQVLNSVIGGRIEQWYVQEGDRVRAGDPIARISEVKDAYLDPATVDRYRDQVTGKRDAVGAKRAKVVALTQQIAALEAGLTFKLSQTRNKVEQYEADVKAAVLDSAIARYQYERQDSLFRQGLTALVTLENARVKSQKADAMLVEKRQGLANARLDLEAVPAEYGEKIAKATSDRAATQAEIGEGNADVAKLQNAAASIEIRNGFYTVRAPQDGIVVRALKQGVGEIIKEGDPVATIQPADAQKAVELWLDPMDVPLVQPGDPVRLQFDGWPALQVVGWPIVAVGTFGGRVHVVDQFESEGGKFRALVVPDPQDEPWPREVRLGTGVYGWAMLKTVSVGWEIWRQINGFPPSIAPPTEAGLSPATSGAGAGGGKGSAKEKK